MEFYMLGSGAGSHLPAPVLILSGACTGLAVIVSAMSIHLQLKNYHKPILQRMVIRIMLMVPIYAISSLISLFSLEAAFVIDAIRDIYEAFVIYCFFHLLLSYLGGERSLLILLHGRPPKIPVFPVSLFRREIDVSDPYTFLFLKRGILQYVQVKPVLALATLILKALGKYNEGDFRANSGYLYVSIVYNASICLSLYCLAMFWMCVNDDLKPFRPIPKFLCVKGILFFSFWQSIFISILVAAGAITKLGPYTDREHISLGLTDTLICVEMPFFAFFHLFAFSYTDYLSLHLSYVARMPMYYAFRDAFGVKDVVEEGKTTLRGEGMDYREFEPSEGFMHQGVGRDRRIRAGLRYSKGGKKKYWLPKTADDGARGGRVGRVMGWEGEGHAPLLQDEGNVHIAPDLQPDRLEDDAFWEQPEEEGDGYELPFGDVADANMEPDEELYAYSRQYLFGDYNYPCIDVSTEHARVAMWDEEERILRDERGAWFSPIRQLRKDGQGPVWEGYGAVGTTQPPPRRGNVLEQSKGKERVTKQILIDYEQDRTPAAESGDVVLKWTKVGRKAQQSQSPTSGPSSAGSSPSPHKHHMRSPPSLSRENSARSPKINLPEDAVDLIVEDDEAAEDDWSRERRKGEPAVKGRGRGSGLKKVYRRGVEAGQGEGEVQIRVSDTNHDTDHGGVGERVLDIEDGAVNVAESAGVIARATTPPVYARLELNDEIDENPWA